MQGNIRLETAIYIVLVHFNSLQTRSYACFIASDAVIRVGGHVAQMAGPFVRADSCQGVGCDFPWKSHIIRACKMLCDANTFKWILALFRDMNKQVQCEQLSVSRQVKGSSQCGDRLGDISQRSCLI